MLAIIDNLLNRITMYRLVLYFLIFLIAVAVGLSVAGILPYEPELIVFSAIFILLISLLTNLIFAYIFDAPANIESVYITALILVLLITPLSSFEDRSYFILAFWASVWAMASKYIFAIHRKHIWNPAAFAVALTALTINRSASWWVGTAVLAPFVFAGGMLIVRKIKRGDLVGGFFIAALVATAVPAFFRGTDFIALAEQIFFRSPIFFFAFIMLTEPLTTPPTKKLRTWYGILVGVLYAPATHIGSFYFTPEIALSVGNIFSYLVSPKHKHILRLKERVEAASGVYDFVFEPEEPIRFRPGQYMEWTLAHRSSDSRGNRRYFTVASSPTEPTIRLGAKFYPRPSSFKRGLLSLEKGDTIVAGGLAGDFILPQDRTQKIAFLAGGIGVTPFRSMIKFLLDTNDGRRAVMMYSAKTADDLAYVGIIEESRRKLGIKTVYVLTDEKISPGLHYRTGRVTADMIAEIIPDYTERLFYLSGPHAMVESYNKMLRSLGIRKSQIKKDYFPGFA